MKSFEAIAENLVNQKHFTRIQVVGDDVTLVGKRVGRFSLSHIHCICSKAKLKRSCCMPCAPDLQTDRNIVIQHGSRFTPPQPSKFLVTNAINLLVMFKCNCLGRTLRFWRHDAAHEYEN